MNLKNLLLGIIVIIITIKLNAYLYMIPSLLALLYFIKIKPNKSHRNLALLVTVISVIVLGFNTSTSKKQKVEQVKVEQPTTISNNSKILKEANVLAFKKEKQLVLNDFDKLKRATGAHIQLQHKHQPKIKRDEKLKFDPIGWHNYEFYYGDGKNKAWLMNRGHLIGYQFSGLNDEGKNLVPMTAWLNAGNFKGMDDTNIDSMLYYENKLDHWLENFPNYWLDYKVTPIYEGNELIPRKIELKYVGMDTNGKLIPIHIGGHATQDKLGVSTVILENISANAKLDYVTGMATNTVAQYVAPAPLPVEVPKETPEEQAPEQQIVQDRIVYVANHGKSKAYWYSTSNMPSNTNMSKVIEMSESEAQAMGKHHSKTE